MTSFSELRQANVNRNEEWNTGDEYTSLAFRGNELAGETGEACNHIKKLERERIGIRGSRSSPEALAEELADIIICADLIAMDLGIDLGDAVASKFDATSEKYGLETRLRTHVSALEADKARLVAVLEDAKGTLGFLRSVIESGERWTMTAEDRYRETRTKIRAEFDAMKGGEDAE